MSKRKAALAVFVRETRGELTQRDFAKELGVSYTYISKIENQHIEIMPSVKFIKKLATIRGMFPDDVMATVGMVDTDSLDAYLDNHPSAAAKVSAVMKED